MEFNDDVIRIFIIIHINIIQIARGNDTTNENAAFHLAIKQRGGMNHGVSTGLVKGD